MTGSGRIIAAMAWTFAFTGGAAAASLTTTPLRIPANGSLDCQLLNAGSKELQEVLIESRILNDAVGSTVGPQTVPAGGTLVALDPNGVGGAASGFCRFEFKGGKKNVRAGACVLDATSFGCTAFSPAE